MCYLKKDGGQRCVADVLQAAIDSLSEAAASIRRSSDGKWKNMIISHFLIFCWLFLLMYMAQNMKKA